MIIRTIAIIPLVSVFLFGCGDTSSLPAGGVEVRFDPGAEFPSPFPGSRVDTPPHLPPVIVGVSAPDDLLYPKEPWIGQPPELGELSSFFSQTGLRGIFIQALPATAGTGAGQASGPFKESGPESEIHPQLLESWDALFGKLSKNGLQVFLDMDPGTESFWETRGGDPSRLAFFNTLADRFEARDNLVFVANRPPGPQGSVVVRDEAGMSGDEGPRDPTLRHVALEMRGQTPNQVHARTVRRWDEIGSRQSLTVFLRGDVGDIEQARRVAWAAAMAGASVFQLGYEPSQGPSEILDDLEHLQAILSVFGAPDAVPMDDLPHDTTTWALAVPGDTYLLYNSDPATKRIGLRSIPRGEYVLTWFDPETGMSLQDSSNVGREGVASWSIPDAFAPEVALHIKRRDPIERIFPGDQWEYSPQSERPGTGEGLEALRAIVGGAGCVVTGGYLSGCWGDVEESGDWASVAKPVQTTLLFKAIAEGRLVSVDAPIAALGWGLRDDDRRITMRSLANMTSGYARGESPGTAFAYNDLGVQLYAESLKRVFGEPMDPVARRIFEPLRLEGDGLFLSRGGAGVSASVLDLCRIGWLWLNRGQWGETEIIPRFFFDTHLRTRIPLDFPLSSEKGDDYLRVGSFGGTSNQYQFGPGVYAFNWWVNLPHRSARAAAWNAAPPDMFFASGHQNREAVIVVPSWDMVVAWRSDRSWAGEDMIPFSPASRLNRALEILGSLPPS